MEWGALLVSLLSCLGTGTVIPLPVSAPAESLPLQNPSSPIP